MKYLEKNSTYKDKKKNVGARVSEVVLSALSNAESDSNDLGYTFSITRIIEKALQDTLDELVDKTGMDYLALEQFKFEMNERQNIRNISRKDSIWIDFEQKSNEIKLRALSDSSVGINLLLKKEEEKMTDYWDKYVINRKEKKVNTELEKLTEKNKILEMQVHHASAIEARNYYDGGQHDCDMAHNDGWGDIYNKVSELADNAYQETFDTLMKKNEKVIQERIDREQKRTRERQKDFLCKKYPEKTDAEIEKIIDTPMTAKEIRSDLGLDPIE